MPSIRCLRIPDEPHYHNSVAESRACWNIAGPPNDSSSYSSPTEAAAVDGPSQKQLNYIELLGGDVTAAQSLSKREASALIDALKKTRDLNNSHERHRAHLAHAAARSGSADYVPEDRLAIIAPMLSVVAEGYYAVELPDDQGTKFLRVSRYDNSENSTHPYRGCTKIQTIHGPHLELAWIIYPDNRVRIFKSGVEDLILLMIVDWRSAAVRYSQKIGRCMRCNLRLTDERSRRLGVGPECEKHMPWVHDAAYERDQEAAEAQEQEDGS